MWTQSSGVTHLSWADLALKGTRRRQAPTGGRGSLSRGGQSCHHGPHPHIHTATMTKLRGFKMGVSDFSRGPLLPPASAQRHTATGHGTSALPTGTKNNYCHSLPSREEEDELAAAVKEVTQVSSIRQQRQPKQRWLLCWIWVSLPFLQCTGTWTAYVTFHCEWGDGHSFPGQEEEWKECRERDRKREIEAERKSAKA